MIKIEQLQKIMTNLSDNRAEIFIDHLNAAMDEFEINTPLRVRMFLAQIAHESGELRYTEEIASGKAYEGRRDLGNTQPGDGVRFKGRGLIQITGRTNYTKCGKALGIDIVNVPDLLEGSVLACRSAAWFWYSRGLNALADKGLFKSITKKINGGLNGQADREKYYERARKVI